MFYHLGIARGIYRGVYSGLLQRCLQWVVTEVFTVYPILLFFKEYRSVFGCVAGFNSLEHLLEVFGRDLKIRYRRQKNELNGKT